MRDLSLAQHGERAEEYGLNVVSEPSPFRRDAADYDVPKFWSGGFYA